MTEKFQIFGSKSSQDYDVLVFVDELSNIDSNHKRIKQFNQDIADLFVTLNLPVKKINANLGVLEQGKLVKVFKGTMDEVNNSLLATYDNHYQVHRQHILYMYDRLDVDYWKHLKLKRCFRFLLSFFSRVPEFRSEIKLALKGNFALRLEALEKIDFNVYTEFPKKEELKEDIYKVMAFQLAQTLCLFHHNYEIFTKEEAKKFYPKMSELIDRNPLNKIDRMWLDEMVNQLICLGYEEIVKMKDLNEEVFNNG